MNRIIFILVLIVVMQLPLVASIDSLRIEESSEGIINFNKSLKVMTADIDSALIYMKLASPILKAEEKWEKYVQSLSGFSFFYHNKNDFEQFRHYAELALSEGLKYLEPTNLMFADIFNNINAIYSRTGNNRKGIELLNKSLEIRKINNENDFQLSSTYQNLGAAYSRMRDHDKAIEYLNLTLNLRIKSDSVPSYNIHFSETYSILGDAYARAERYDSSIHYYKKSLSTIRDKNAKKSEQALNFEIIALQQIAENLILIGNLNEAKEYLDDVFKIHQKNINVRKPSSIYLLSKLHFLEGQYDEALKQIDLCINFSIENKNEDTPPILAKRYNLKGEILNAKKEYNKAINTFSSGLDLLMPADNDYSLIYAKTEALNLMNTQSKSLFELAKISSKNSDLNLTFDAYLNSIKLLREMRKGIVSAKSKNTLASKSMSIYEEALSIAFEIYKKDKNTKILNQVYEIIESNKSLLLLESYNKQISLGTSGVSQDMIDLQYDLSVDIAFFSKELALKLKSEPEDQNEVQQIQTRLQILKAKSDSLTFKISQTFPDYNQFINLIDPPSLSKLQEKLQQENNTILEFFYGENNLFMLIIGGEETHFLKYNSDDLNSNIEQLREMLSFSSSLSSNIEDFDLFYKTSSDLYNKLFKPCLKYISKNQNKITIIPDGYISSVPFDILISGHSNEVDKSYSSNYLQYLIEDFNISYAYSSYLYLKRDNDTQMNYKEKFIGFAPVFESPDNSTERICECDGIALQNLSCNSSEVQVINKIAKGSSYFSKQATKKNFLQNAINCEIIHIASHACIDKEDGLLNQMFFTDGGITNYELQEAKLNSELAVLSACNTGIGKIQKGEGVMNLAKGFLMAGTNSVLMSLWAVNDCSTSTLMEQYYTNLSKSETKTESIRHAKLEFLNNADKLKAHPYYWGAFVHYGSIRPIRNQSKPIFYLMGLIISILLILTLFKLKTKR